MENSNVKVLIPFLENISIRSGEEAELWNEPPPIEVNRTNYLVALISIPEFPDSFKESAKEMTRFTVVCASYRNLTITTYVTLDDFAKNFIGNLLVNSMVKGHYLPNTWVYLSLNKEIENVSN